MATKITIGLSMYNGTACSFFFNDSVCVVEEKLTDMQLRNIRKLEMLFRGSTIEYDVDGEKPAEKPKKKEKKAEAPKPEPVADEPPPAPAPEEVPQSAEGPGEEAPPALENENADALKEAVAEDHAAKEAAEAQADETEEMPAADEPKAAAEEKPAKAAKKAGKKGKGKR